LNTEHRREDWDDEDLNDEFSVQLK
jgi:hypothetical protein